MLTNAGMKDYDGDGFLEFKNGEELIKIDLNFLVYSGSTVKVNAAKKFAEDIRYSDPVSSDALGDIEQELAAAVEELQAAVVDGDGESVAQLCRKASAVLSERNRLCKLGKNR